MPGAGEPVDPAVLTELREWWPVDGLCVVMTVMPGIDLRGQAGDVAGLLELAEAAERSLDRAWGDYYAIVRIAALVAGQVASAWARLDPGAERPRPRRRPPTGGSRAFATTGADVEPHHRPAFERSARAELEETGREAWAWLTRLEAELARLEWAAGSEDAPRAADLVEVWRTSVSAFDRYGHVFEGARSRARLAAALHATGDEAGSRETAAAARQVAISLGSAPLLAELDAVHPSAAASGTAETPLTPREVEVLTLVAQGLTNGQIGRQLFISTKTVSVHVSNLLAKLGAAGRTEAAAIARRRGLVP